MNWKKAILILLVLGILIGGAGWYYYKKELPQMVADAVINDEYPTIMPGKVVEKIRSSKEEVNNKVENVLTSTKTAGITVDQLILAIDEVKEEEARKMVDVLFKTDIKNVEQVFDIGIENIHIETFNPELLREAFIANVEMKHIRKGMKYIENHDLLNTMGHDMAREIAKAVIKAKAEKIKQKTDIIE